mmetsp:Transcript_21607/g.49127  ORF Transcript_21607/g.49127 Transcript_21607/m.49127 type:complete len:138 (-) Transcript_21607:559-972(-)
MIGYLRREIHATQSASRDAGFLYLPGEDLSERVLDPQERGRTVLAVHAPRCTTAEVPGRERDAPEEEEKKDGRRGGARSEREYGLYVSCRPDPVRTPTGGKALGASFSCRSRFHPPPSFSSSAPPFSCARSGSPRRS